MLLMAYVCQAFSQVMPKKCATHLIEKQTSPNYEKTKREFELSLERIIRSRKALKTADDELVIIPVVVHVMHPNLALGVKQNISDKMIQDQIGVINMDFRRLNKDTNKTLQAFKHLSKDSKIQFCLAKVRPDCAPTNGIVRVSNAAASYNAFDLAPMKELSHWPSDQYLNIWVTDLDDGYVGYSTFPYQAHMDGLVDNPENENPIYDGVTIDYRCFGVGAQLKAGYRLGRTLTHEIGHWLGLRHLWGDSYCGTDYCDDTPIQDQGSSGCVRRTACDDNGQTMMENFMDYTSDECMNMFSADQITRMRTILVISERRRKLIENNVCAKSPLATYIPDFEGFEEGLPNNYLLFNNKADISNVGGYGGSNSSFHLSVDSSTHLLASKLLALQQTPNIKYLNFELAVLKASTVSDDTILINYLVGCDRTVTTILKIPVDQLSKESKSLPLASDWKDISLKLETLKMDYLNLEIVYKNADGDRAEVYLDNILFSEDKVDKLNIRFDYTSQELIFNTRHAGLNNLAMEIYSPDGKLIYKNTYLDRSSATIALDKIANPSSIYLVKAVYDGRVYTYKFAYLRQ